MLETVKRISAGGESSQLDAALSGGKHCPAEPDLYKVGRRAQLLYSPFSESTVTEQFQQRRLYHGSR
jgi:hypothetical protein